MKRQKRNHRWSRKASLFVLALCLVVSRLILGCSGDDPFCEIPLGTGTFTQPSAIGETRLALSWTHEGESNFYTVEYGIEGFQLGTGTQVGNEDSPLFRPFIAQGLQHETTYDFYVKVQCEEGGESKFAGPAKGTTKAYGEGCTPPSNLAVAKITNSTIDITWDANNMAFWNVEWTLVGNPFGDNVRVAFPEHQISDLQPNTAYEIRVKTDCFAGFYDFSDPTFDLVIQVTTLE